MTKKIIVFIEVLTLILLWVCTLFLNATTGLLWVNIVSSLAMSISSLGTGFILYEIWKEWKEIESNKS
ncbi:hypothetical protein FDG95_gp078 [Pectobacterium phage vB_PcaM_CBB]|uniref:Putative membrane protein n=1 Tax=Pectobacterium phage vB_PcaM_CBB TaxID=2772511 RepID=A0A1L2CUE3_9CAUD|nr:hypothetical protein FDG95_gp078 [Pectobacterium phage vB_PcaM_CBB]AMM43643.1 putative membrane protein [Pectobacterium phage vB_PcaM_CBB]